MTEDPPELHELLGPLAFLIGEWHGSGEGLWAGGFSFTDAVRFSHDGRPLLRYDQVTVGPDGRPSHAETGFFAVQSSGDVHVTLAQPTGITEVLVGHPEAGVLRLDSVEIGHTPTTDNVTGCRRRLRLEGESLVTEVDIAVNDAAFSPHTRSVLQRVV